MPFWFFDGTIVLLLPALALTIWAQTKVKSTYAKYSQVGVRSGLSGAEAAAQVLRDAGVPLQRGAGWNDRGACAIESVGGQLTDHYDPRSRTLRLSQDIYHGRSIAALGVAAHEAGHAIQHARDYAPLTLRGTMYPLSAFGSAAAFPLFFVGLLFPAGAGQLMMNAAIVLFSVAVFFTLVTLPVEFNASKRALLALSNGGYMTADELLGAKKVLDAAALTYVASAAMAVLQLVRMLLLANRE